MDNPVYIVSLVLAICVLVAFFGMYSNIKQIKNEILSSRREQARANYFKYFALKDNQKAYEELLYIIFSDLVSSDHMPEQRKYRYNELKEKYQKTCDLLGFPFPDFPM